MVHKVYEQGGVRCEYQIDWSDRQREFHGSTPCSRSLSRCRLHMWSCGPRPRGSPVRCHGWARISPILMLRSVAIATRLEAWPQATAVRLAILRDARLRCASASSSQDEGRRRACFSGVCRMDLPFDPARVQLLSFDVFGTLISVRDGSYGAFRRILEAANARHIDVKRFWEVWEEHNIKAYWRPWRPYKNICEESLAAAFEAFGVNGRPDTISCYFAAFTGFELYPDVVETLDVLSRRFKLAIVSNIDDDLLAATPLKRSFDLVCTAERAKGYKPDGSLFRYLLANAGVGREAILHSGQSQFTDLVGAKPLGLTVAWINRRGIPLSADVPAPDFQYPDVRSLLTLLRGS